MRAAMIDTQAISTRRESVGSKLDERGRRVFAAGEVRATGWGSLEAVSEITGLARSTIGRVTPTWKLVNVSANTGNVPFSNVGRTRTHDLFITIGPNNQQTINSHVASQRKRGQQQHPSSPPGVASFPDFSVTYTQLATWAIPGTEGIRKILHAYEASPFSSIAAAAQ